MEESIPGKLEETLAEHDTVRSLISLCIAATRRWIEGEVSRAYLMKLTARAGICICNAKRLGLEGHRANSLEAKREADFLLAQLVEARELLHAPRYAAASLHSDTILSDTPHTRRMMVEHHILIEPSREFPEP